MKDLTNVLIVKRLTRENQSLWSIKGFTLENVLFAVQNVRRLSKQNLSLWFMIGITPVKDLTNAPIVIGLLEQHQNLGCTRRSHLVIGLSDVRSVTEASFGKLILLFMKEITVLRDPLSVVNVENSSGQNLTRRDMRKVIGFQMLLNAKYVKSHLKQRIT